VRTFDVVVGIRRRVRSTGQIRMSRKDAFHTVYAVKSSSARGERPNSAAIDSRFAEWRGSGMVVSSSSTMFE